MRPSNKRVLMEQIARMGAYATSHRIAWRGLKNANYDLTSTLQREVAKDEGAATEAAMREREARTLQEARKWGLDIVGGRRVDDLQLLADLQHYGVPTRFLDFTSNPMTALWFACEKEARSKRHHPECEVEVKESSADWSASGLVLAMNISPWYRKEDNEGSGEKRTIYETVVEDPWVREEPEGSGLLRFNINGPSDRLEEALTLDSPFLVSSSTPNPRLRAQEGFFIASALPDAHDGPVGALKWKGAPLRGNSKRRNIIEHGAAAQRGYPSSVPFMAFYVDATWKDGLRTLLRQNYRQKASVLFPDFSGFALHRPWLD